MPLAHPQQRSSLHAAQLLLPMQLNRISDPGHPDLRQHAIPPAKTGQIVCSQTRTYLVSATLRAIFVAKTDQMADNLLHNPEHPGKDRFYPAAAGASGGKAPSSRAHASGLS